MPEQCDLTARPVLRSVVDYVGPLTEGSEVRVRVVGRIVISVSGRKDHLRPPHAP